MVTTDYTKKTESTLKGAQFSRYRFMHWLVDILKNFFSDPINIKDTRLRGLLRLQDGAAPDDCKALFKIDVPYSKNSKKACTTPSILVSAGEDSIALTPVNTGVDTNTSAINATQQYRRTLLKTVGCRIAVITESCDGTVLLSDIIAQFLRENALSLILDGMLSQLDVTQVGAVEEVGGEAPVNAKSIYQSVISVAGHGAITWASDSQGPVFRGLSLERTYL